MRNETPILERRFVPEGKMIVSEGEDGNCAYLVQSGSVEVFTIQDGKEVSLAKLGMGQIFGEMALITDEKRKANVRACENSNLIIITRQNFEDRLENSDRTIRAIVRMLADRVLKANETVGRQRADIDSLIRSVQGTFDAVVADLPKDQKQTFENIVEPHYKSFVSSIEEFRDRYKLEE